MKYYTKIEGGWPNEVSYQTYRNAVRRKGTREQNWLNGGEMVARCAILPRK